MTSAASTLATQDGVALAWREWSARGPVAGSVLIVHGLGEHLARHAPLAERLAGAGWQVFAFDQRGHGNSPGRRGDLPHATALLDDVASAVERVRGLTPVGPLVLLGHSLGGMLAARFVAEGLAEQPALWCRAVDALVLSSPALDPGMNMAQKLLLAVARRAFPHLAVNNGLKPAWISRDAAVVRAYVSDPLVHDRVTAALAQFLLDAAAVVQQRAAHWRVPTLLMWAGADRCVAPRGSALFAAAAPPARVTAQVFPALFHEIFNEPEREQVIGVLLGWLAQRPGRARP